MSRGYVQTGNNISSRTVYIAHRVTNTMSYKTAPNVSVYTYDEPYIAKVWWGEHVKNGKRAIKT